MARPRKTGLDYFPFDVDFFEDEKMVAIAGEFGIKGEITAVKLLCAVYRNGYFMEWNELLKMKMLRSLPGIGPELLEQIVNRLVKWGFFDKALFDSARVLTSKGIQRRFLNSAKKRLQLAEYPYWLFPAEEIKVSATEMPQRKEKERKKSSTPVEDEKTPPSPQPYSSHLLTLDEEIETLKAEEAWLAQLQVLHHIGTGALRRKLDDFKVQCVADGKERHHSMQDAKQHFNAWLRVVINKNKQEKDVTVGSDSRNQRRGNVLSADEKKTYGDSF